MSQVFGKRVIFIIPLCLVAFLVWAASFELISEIRSKGFVVTESKRQVVSHKEGGVLQRILVAEGDRVDPDSPLLIVQNLQVSEQMTKIEAQISQLNARIARLKAESSNTSYDWVEGMPIEDFRRERQRYQSRREAMLKQVEVLVQQRMQKQSLIASLKAEERLILDEIELTTRRWESVKRLNDMGAGSASAALNAEVELIRGKNRLNNARRELVQTEGLINELTARIEYQQADYYEKANGELDKAEVELNTATAELESASVRAKRQEILSPASGIVHQVHLRTVGAAVRPNQELIEIIPDHQEFIVEAQLDIAKRDQVWTNMEARVMPLNNSEYIFKPLIGHVEDISADTLYDSITREAYFKVTIQMKSENSQQLSALHQGMQVGVRLSTGTHKVLEYLGRPILRAFSEALTEPLPAKRTPSVGA